MEEAEILCDRVAIMDHAKILALDTPQNLIKAANIDSTIEFRMEQAMDTQIIKALPGVQEAAAEDGSYRVISNDPAQTLSALFHHAQKTGLKLLDMQLRQPTLEDVFLKLTGHRLRD